MSIYPQLIDKTISPAADRAIGVLTSTAGYIGPGSLTGSGSAGAVNYFAAGAISTSELHAGSITATQLSSTSVSALFASLGTITAGSITLTGSVAQNFIRIGGPYGTIGSPGTPQLQLDSTGIWMKDAVGADKIRMDSTTGIISAVGVFTLNNGSLAPWQTAGWYIGGGNMVGNSSFEENAVGTDPTVAFTTASGQSIAAKWSKSGISSATVVDSTTTGMYHGGRALRITSTGGSPALTSVGTYTVQAAKRYSASFWAKQGTAAGRFMYISVDWYNGATYLSTTTSPGMALSGSWNRETWTGAAPATATGGVLYISGAGWSAGETAYVDAIQLEAGDAPTAYAPREDEILASSITAGMITVANLSALSADMGTVTAGTYKTSATAGVGSPPAAGMILNTGGLNWYDGSGAQLRADPTNGLAFIAPTNAATLFQSLSYHDTTITGTKLAAFDAYRGTGAGTDLTVARVNSYSSADITTTAQVTAQAWDAASGQTNAYIVTNYRGGASTILNVSGDGQVTVGSASRLATILNASDASSFVRYSNGSPRGFTKHPSSRSYNTSAQACASSATVTFTYTNSRWGSNNITNGTGLFTAPVAGLYQVTFNGAINTGASVNAASNVLQVRLWAVIGGVARMLAVDQQTGMIATTTYYFCPTTTINLAAGETVYADMFQNTGATVNAIAGFPAANSYFDNELSVVWVGPPTDATG